MRVKGHLAARGVEFVAIDVTSDKEALNELHKLGARGLPVVSANGRYVLGYDLAKVDELVGLNNASSLLSADELTARAVKLLAAATRYATQLPPAHYDDPVPGMEGVKPPFKLPGGHVLVLADGTPYVPHGTYLGLYRHIIGHGTHYKHFLEQPEDTYYATLATYTQFGEPSLHLSMAELAAMCNAVVEGIVAFWRTRPRIRLDRVLDTFTGEQTLHQMLHRETYSLAQHTRQLMHVLLKLNITPDGAIGEPEFEGLNVPPRIWD